ncbi:hypothetical protein IKF63_01960, partial [Candidatus Saccharibacteria bacterium]|nr:hypothetical protein [Candidatus Saccharibacteria bacterium]
DSLVEYNLNKTRNENGVSRSTLSKCYTVTNPMLSYTALYSASTSGHLNQDSGNYLEIDGSRLNGRIKNTRKKADGTWEYVYPNYSTYTATFTHTLSRTNSADAKAPFSNTTKAYYKI